MQQDKRNVPDWLLERLALGELDAETAADVRRRLVAEGRSPDDVIAAAAASNREILEKLPATPTAEAIRRRAEKAAERPVRRRAFLWTLPIAVAGGVAASLLMTGPTERIKGEPLKVYVYRHSTTGDELLPNGARAASGDLLQLAYSSKDGGYGVLLSIDGARKVTLHLPENENGKAAPLREGGARAELTSAYQLDDAPAFERFVLVRAAAPFSIATAVEAARAVAAQPSARTRPLALPPGFEQISLAVDKTHAGKKELP
jgi:hypothetical protein